MSASEILEQIRRLPVEEQYDVAEEFGDVEDELTPEQIAEFERRGEELARNPQSGIPWDQVRAELKERIKGRSSLAK